MALSLRRAFASAPSPRVGGLTVRCAGTLGQASVWQTRKAPAPLPEGTRVVERRADSSPLRAVPVAAKYLPRENTREHLKLQILTELGRGQEYLEELKAVRGGGEAARATRARTPEELSALEKIFPNFKPDSEVAVAAPLAYAPGDVAREKRKLADHARYATSKHVSSDSIKTSPFKLNLLCRSIRRLPVEDAIAQLRFSPKLRSKEVLTLLEKCISELLEQGATMDELTVHEAHVGVAEKHKKLRYRARGKVDMLVKQRSKLTLSVKGPLKSRLEERSAAPLKRVVARP